LKAENYEKFAMSFLSRRVDGEELLGFTDKEGSKYRYDKKRNLFATADPDGITETIFKPSNGFLYWEKQMEKHGKTKN